jgi:hypothetical protein
MSNNLLAYSPQPYWDFIAVNSFVVNIYYDQEMVASIDRLSENENWNLTCISGYNKESNSDGKKYRTVLEAFEDAKEECKKYY